MKDVSTLTSDDILGIPADTPELLFTGDEAIAKREWRKLVSKWHPDQNTGKDVTAVVSHINVLYDKALQLLAAGCWVIPGQVSFNTIDGKTFQLKYRSSRQFELGDIYVGDTIVAYSLFKDNSDLFQVAKKNIKGLKFANDKMKSEMKRFLPEIAAELETDDRVVVIFKKTPDQLLLSDVLDHYKGSMDPKHVAWVLSRLYNLVCYLKYANIVHSGITLDACFISPEFHSVSLLGGWWYSTETGKKLTALPSIALEYGPEEVLKTKLSDQRIDLELVRVLGRRLLGDEVGSKLLMDKNVPAALTTWLRTASKGDAFKEYDLWQNKVLLDSFGKRKFVELNLTATDLYGDKK